MLAKSRWNNSIHVENFTRLSFRAKGYRKPIPFLQNNIVRLGLNFKKCITDACGILVTVTNQYCLRGEAGVSATLNEGKKVQVFQDLLSLV